MGIPQRAKPQFKFADNPQRLLPPGAAPGFTAKILHSCKCALGFPGLAVMTAAIAVLAAVPVAAQPVFAPNSSVYGRSPYCGSYTLTAPKFMNMVKAIVNHDDLTDVPFIEKTLGTKLVSHDFLINGKPDTRSSIYRVWQVQGVPISVTLVIYRSEALQRKLGSVAQIFIESDTLPGLKTDFFRDCLDIQISQIYPFFANAKKTHPKMSLNIMYNRKDNLVRGIALYQKP